MLWWVDAVAEPQNHRFWWGAKRVINLKLSSPWDGSIFGTASKSWKSSPKLDGINPSGSGAVRRWPLVWLFDLWIGILAPTVPTFPPLSDELANLGHIIRLHWRRRRPPAILECILIAVLVVSLGESAWKCGNLIELFQFRVEWLMKRFYRGLIGRLWLRVVLWLRLH